MKTKSKPPVQQEVKNEIPTSEIIISIVSDAYKQQQQSQQINNIDLNELQSIDDPLQQQYQFTNQKVSEPEKSEKLEKQEKQEKIEFDDNKARIDVDTIKKRPTGFNFLKKKENQEASRQEPTPPVSNQKEVQQSPTEIQEASITDDGYQQKISNFKEDQINLVDEYPKQNEEHIQLQPHQEITPLPPIIEIEIKPKELQQQQTQEEQKRSTSFLTNFKNKKQLQPKSEILTDQAYRAKYTVILQDIDEFERNLSSKLIQIFMDQLQSEKKIVDLQKKMELLGAKLSQLTARQQEYIEKELFDQAEEIEQQIQKSKDEITKYEFQIQNLNVKNDQLQQEKEKMKSDEVPFCATMAEKLEEIEKIHKRYIEEYKLDQQNQLKKLLTQIEEENERVKISQIHIEIDMKHIDEEQEHIHQALNNQTKEYREKLIELNNRKIQLEQIIIELNRQLKEKQQDLDHVIEDLDEAEQQVMTVEQKFTQQLQKVDNKRFERIYQYKYRQKLQEEMQQLEQERASITKIENDYQRKQRELENKTEVLNSQLSQMIEKKQNLFERADQIPEQWHKEITIIEEYKQANTNTYYAYCQMQMVERLIEDLQYKKSSGQSQLSDMIDQKKKIQDKLPRLLEDKQTLIQNKNFKGAGAITIQIKEAQSQIEKLDQSIQENTKKEGELIQMIEEQEQIKLEKKENYEGLKRISEVSRYFVLELRLNGMNKLMKSNLGNETLRQQILEIESEMQALFRIYEKEISQPKGLLIQEEEVENQRDENEQNICEQTNQNFVLQNEDISIQQDNNEQLQSQEDQQQQQAIEEEFEVSIEISDEQKKLIVENLLQQLVDGQNKIDQLEELMNELASNDQFEEADQLKQEQDQIKLQIEKYQELITIKYKFASVELAKEWVEQQ